MQDPKIIVNISGLYALLAALNTSGSATIRGNDLYIGPTKVLVVDKIPEPHVVAPPDPEGFPV